MKPLDGTFAQNALAYGVAGLNIDGCRIGKDKVTINTWDDGAKPFGGGAGHAYTPKQVQGRWPVNVILDEEAGKMLDEQTRNVRSSCGGGNRTGAKNKTSEYTSTSMGTFNVDNNCSTQYHDHGGPSRFFYTAKASRAERTHKGTIANNHPTVKPLSLMRWLCRLVSTPTGGIILDPFAGSGSTGVAALQEGLSFVGIELEEKYVAIAEERLASVWPKEELKEETKPEQDQAGDDIYFL
jgi:site-specific DNA-methyltransferase (adenine-specific)